MRTTVWQTSLDSESLRSLAVQEFWLRDRSWYPARGRTIQYCTLSLKESSQRTQVVDGEAPFAVAVVEGSRDRP